MIGTKGETPGFLFDANRCTGCSACTLACTTENSLPWGTSWRQVVPFNESRRPGVPSFHLSLACNHCDDAPCVAQCPSMAIQRDAATGSVLIRDDRCIGCGFCAWVCPYDAPLFDPARGVMSKCTQCRHRLVDGREPACVESCPTGALGFGPLEGETELPGFPERPARPRIRFVSLRRGGAPPELSRQRRAEEDGVFRQAANPHSPRRLSLRGEAPLWLFTTGAAGLVGWVLAAAWGGVALPGLSFLLLAAATLGVSTLHLGRKSRAWRAMLNLRRSRLSREVVGYSAFVAVAAAWRILAPDSTAVGVAAAGVGMLALFAMDRVYDPVRRAHHGALHSADVVLTGPLVAAAILQASGAFVLVAVAKTVLFLWRASRPGTLRRLPRAFVWARVGLGLALPPVIWALVADPWSGFALLPVAVGELADRGIFYQELEVTNPRSEARRRAAEWPETRGSFPVAGRPAT